LQGFKFDAVLTAQDIGSYKPDPRNFEYMLEEVEKRFGVKKQEVIQTAQSQFHDHQPARKIGINSAWIVRSSAVKGEIQKEGLIYNWRFDKLGDMADAVEKEAVSQ
jgi:FMN phosphatase YigB (HAD superfamily)